jgi:hypothetical protein
MKAPDSQLQSSLGNGLPETPVGRWTRPFVRFMQIESAGGFVLLACTVAALLLANSSSTLAPCWSSGSGCHERFNGTRTENRDLRTIFWETVS